MSPSGSGFSQHCSEEIYPMSEYVFSLFLFIGEYFALVVHDVLIHCLDVHWSCLQLGVMRNKAAVSLHVGLGFGHMS